MIEIYSSDSTIQDQLMSQRLAHQGFHPILKNADMASMIGMSPIAMPCSICVPESEAEAATATAALKILSEQTTHSISETPKSSRHCHADWEEGFEVCWNCQKYLTD